MYYTVVHDTLLSKLIYIIELNNNQQYKNIVSIYQTHIAMTELKNTASLSDIDYLRYNEPYPKINSIINKEKSLSMNSDGFLNVIKEDVELENDVFQNPDEVVIDVPSDFSINRSMLRSYNFEDESSNNYADIFEDDYNDQCYNQCTALDELCRGMCFSLTAYAISLFHSCLEHF